MHDDSAPTRKLLARIAGGDRGAFNELFERHRFRLKKAISLRMDKRLKSRVDESDVVQETQLIAFRRLNDYLSRRPMPFGLWLRKTAQEQLISQRRGHLDAAQRSVHKERPLPSKSSILLAAPFVDREPSPSQRQEAREYRRLVTEAVNELPETDREILMMRNLEGLSHQEIAQLLDVSHEAVRKRYGRALIKLQRLLSLRGLAESSDG
jgi:RNA polymerase sigma-70 factor (ECF subfamily)